MNETEASRSPGAYSPAGETARKTGATEKSCVMSEEAKLEEQEKAGQGKGTRGAGGGEGTS